MKNISNAALTDALEKRVESHLQDAINIFQNMQDEELLRPSTSGGWSIAQCLWHLNSYGDYYLPLIKGRLERADKNESEAFFNSGWLGNYFTRMMEPGDAMKKYKAFKDHTPGNDLNAHEVVAEFIRQQESLLEYLRLAKNVNLNAIRIPISISKLVRLKLGDVFQFIVAHDERHIQQAKRNVNRAQIHVAH